jgi:hypothetical protein
MTKRTVCIDVDGVLAQYDGWKGVDHFGDPIPGARAFLAVLREEFDVVIFTTRTNPEMSKPESAELLRNRVRDWLDANDLPYDDIWIGRGKPICSAIIDDRAVSCRPQDAFADAIWEARCLADPEPDDSFKCPPYTDDVMIPELLEVRTEIQRQMASEG